MKAHFPIPKEQLEDFCRRRGIKRLFLFGSVLRDDFGPESDIDMLVEFKPDVKVGLFGLADMEAELSGIIGRKVDMNTSGCLSPFFKDEVLAEAEVQYEQA